MPDGSLFYPTLKHAGSQTLQNHARYQASSVVPQSWLCGLLAGAVHDIEGGNAIMGFAALLLAGTASAPIVWAGDQLDLYPPGLCWYALEPARVIIAEAAREADRLGALEIALRGGMHGVAMVERVSRLAARRLALAARCGGGVGLVLRPDKASDSTAFSARWRISAAKSRSDDAPRWRAELLYARGRFPGVFLFEADRHATPPALTLVSEPNAATAIRPRLYRAR